MLCAMYEEKHHDGRTDGGILRGCQDGKQLPRPVERVLASNDRGPQPLRDAQRQTQTRAVPRASTTAATAAIPFPVRSVPKGSLDHYFGQNRPATTGGAQGAASGHRLHTLPETGRGRGHECVVQGGADFQGQAGSGAGMAARSTTSPNGPGLDHVQGTDGSAEPDSRFSGEAAEGHGQRLAGLHGLAVSEVERGPTSARSGLFETTDTGRSDAGPPRHHPAVPEAPDRHEVPVQKETDGNHDLPGHVSSGHLPQMSQCGHHVGHHEDSAEQRGVSIGGDGIQNGGIGFRGPGEAASRHDLPEEMSTSALHAQALQLVLINHGNTCYMNALIQVMVSCMTPGGIR